MVSLVDEPAVSELPRAPRKRWLLVVGYVAAIAFFILASSLDWVAAAGGLFWAAVIRGAYVAFSRRRDRDRSFMSPWFFVLAGVCAIFTLVGTRAQDEEATNNLAVEQGLVASADDASPVDRCIAKVLDQVDEMTDAQRANVISGSGGDLEGYSRRFCREADSQGALASNGDVRQTDELVKAACVDAVMTNFGTIPTDERRFSSEDFTKVADRYCDEAIRRDLIEGGRDGRHNAELEKIQVAVVDELLLAA